MSKKVEFKAFFLDRYLANGLGSMNKKDIDTLVMYLLDECGDAIDNKPYRSFRNHQVAEKLKIGVARVQTLRQDAMLKFMDESVRVEKAKAKLILVAINGKYNKSNDMVEFTVDDAYARSWIQEQFNLKGIVYDSSFNKDIIRVRFEAFQKVFQDIFKVRIEPPDKNSELTDGVFKEWIKKAISEISVSDVTNIVLEVSKFALEIC